MTVKTALELEAVITETQTRFWLNLETAQQPTQTLVKYRARGRQVCPR